MNPPRDEKSSSCCNLAVIAKEAGVSRMTVSRAMRNAGCISPQTRARVLAAAEKLGYRPNPLVSALMTQIHHGKLHQADNVIAYLTSSKVKGGWRDNETYSKFFDGASERAFRRGYRVEEFWLGEPGVSAVRLSRVLYARGIRGIIVGPMASPHGHLSLKWNQFSAVAIGYSLLRPALDRASNDQYNSTLTALRELRRLGCRRIGMAIDARAAARVHYRWPSAFLMHQWRHGPRDHSLLYLPDHWRQWRRDDFCAWVREAKLDALVTLEVTAYTWLREAGYRVPEDIAVAHLDWTVRQPFWAGIDQRSGLVGGAAVDLVIERINNNEVGVPDHPRIVTLSGEWVDGSTVNKAPRARAGRNTENPPELADAVAARS